MNEDIWAASTASAGSAGSYEGLGAALDEVHEHLATYINPVDETDLELLALWITHTHFVADVFYTTPRLLIDSPLAGSGKTTVLEHCERLCFKPLLAARITSSAFIPRMLKEGPRTLLIDEAEKSLRPDRPGVEDLLSIINSGYKRGATAPILIPGKGGEWIPSELPTFAAVAMAGINPGLPDDTVARCLKVLLLPDIHGDIEDSDWEFIEDETNALADRLKDACDSAADEIKKHGKPELPDGVRGRMKEKWRPLQRVADIAGGQWPGVCRDLIKRELSVIEMEREEGMTIDRPAVTLLRDLVDQWPDGEKFWPTKDMVEHLHEYKADSWGSTDKFPKGLTPQRMGRMLWRSWGIKANRQRQTSGEPRGYFHVSILKAAVRVGVDTPPK